MDRFRPAAAALAIFAAAPLAAQQFHASEIVPGGRIVSIVTRDFDGDGRIDLIVLYLAESETEPGARHLAVYLASAPGGEGGIGFTRARDFTVPDDAVAFGLGDFLGLGRPHLVYFTARSVVAIDPATLGARRLLGDLRFFFNRPSDTRLPFWDYLLDLNADGRDDLILADARGHRIYMQEEGGELREAGRVEGDYSFSLGRDFAASEGRPRGGAIEGAGAFDDLASLWGPSVPAAARTRAITTSRRVGRVCVVDINGDGRSDLITMKDGHLLAFVQSADGRFDSEPTTQFRLGASDSGSILGRGGRLPIIHGDVDRDGRIDFILAELDPENLTTSLRYYRWAESGVPGKPDQIIKLGGLGEEPGLLDVNGDGYLDLAYLAINTERLLRLRLPTVEKVQVVYSVYLYDPAEGRFATRPSLRKEIEVALTDDLGEGQARDLMRYDGDFNGDGVRDLLAYENEGELLVYLCEAGARDPMKLSIGSRPAARLEFDLPRALIVEDLDGDGRDDLLLRYRESMTILRSRE